MINTENLENAIKKIKDSATKRILEETKSQLISIWSQPIPAQTKLLSLSEIQNDAEAIKFYKEICRLESALNCYFDMQEKINSEWVKLTKKDSEELQGLMYEWIKIGWKIITYLSEVMHKNPKAITKEWMNFLEIYRSFW